MPEAVAAELDRGRTGSALAGFASERPTWIEMVHGPATMPPLLEAYLDPGEAAVIAVALGFPAAIVLIDERRGRLVARTMNLAVVGSVGVLLRARREGLLPEIRPCLDAMRSQGIWLSDAVREFTLRQAGEV